MSYPPKQVPFHKAFVNGVNYFITGKVSGIMLNVLPKLEVKCEDFNKTFLEDEREL